MKTKRKKFLKPSFCLAWSKCSSFKLYFIKQKHKSLKFRVSAVKLRRANNDYTFDSMATFYFYVTKTKYY